MNFVSFEISIVSLLPALFLCGFIYYKDRIEKEPVGLLALLFLAGAAAYVPTLYVEKLIGAGLDRLFSGSISYSADGAVRYSSDAASFAHKALCAFLAVALAETAVKWGILYFGTRRNKHFNYLFDGIVYSVFISLGFAAAENIRYAWINGWDTLGLRLLSSVPCHLFVGILMGYYYTMWKAHRRAGEQEEALIGRGLLAEEKIRFTGGRLALSLAVPMIISGICMTAGSVDSRIMNTLFYFLVFMLYGVSFIGIDRIASRDSAAVRFSAKLLREKHPEADDAVWAAAEADNTGAKEDAQ